MLKSSCVSPSIIFDSVLAVPPLSSARRQKNLAMCPTDHGVGKKHSPAPSVENALVKTSLKSNFTIAIRIKTTTSWGQGPELQWEFSNLLKEWWFWGLNHKLSIPGILPLLLCLHALHAIFKVSSAKMLTPIL